MMAASTLMAVRVWLRASERISVNVLDLLKCVPQGDREETDQRKRDQIRRHRSLHRKKVRHDRCAQSFPGTNRYPLMKGAAGGGGFMPRRTPTRSRVPAKLVFRKARISKGSDDGALTTPRQGARGGCGVVPCGRRPIQESRFEKDNEKARGGFLRAGFDDCCDDGVMPVICPTCQPLFRQFRNCRKGASSHDGALAKGRAVVPFTKAKKKARSGLSARALD
jgi:hypothetical protein